MLAVDVEPSQGVTPPAVAHNDVLAAAIPSLEDSLSGGSGLGSVSDWPGPKDAAQQLPTNVLDLVAPLVAELEALTMAQGEAVTAERPMLSPPGSFPAVSFSQGEPDVLVCSPGRVEPGALASSLAHARPHAAVASPVRGEPARQ